MDFQPKQPTLLMLSHCVPDALGNAARARVWQLLRLVSRSYKVHLACRMDGPIRLDQWRAARGLTGRLAMQMPATRLHPFDWFRRQLAPTLGSELGDIVPESGADVVLCTHPALMADSQRVDARFKVCDVDAPASAWALGAARQPGLSPERLAETFDLLTTGHASYLEEARLLHRPAIVLPDAVDLASFPLQPSAAVAEPPAPLLLFHANWQGPAAQEPFTWFRRNVWPAVQQAVPEATFARTPSAHEIGAAGSADLLRAASLVVLPEGNPRLARWPVMQAMASQRPVIANASAVEDLGARDGVHLLTAARERDWSRLCIESLRSARIRLKLALGARAFLEHYATGDAGVAMLRALDPREGPPTSLSRAA
ncbi:MAG: hypothetical protein NTW19_09400 [Planctomycetota bacterium]|nr:hypothetical protein [Planctomycetota bacterium]